MHSDGDEPVKRASSGILCNCVDHQRFWWRSDSTPIAAKSSRMLGKPNLSYESSIRERSQTAVFPRIAFSYL
jgi:hypothetical protein